MGPTDADAAAERAGGLAILRRMAVDVTPLRESQPFRRLWFGTGISAIGSQITTVAIPFQVYALAGSTLLVGLLAIAARVPLLFVAEAASTAAYGFQRPARNALTARIVAPDRLTAAIAIEDVIFNFAHVGGP